MKAEDKILSYLMKYGNTRVCDLINFGVNKFGCTSVDVKRTIDCLAIEGRVHRIVHDKLDPPEVYVSLIEPLPPVIMRGLIEASTSKAAERDAAAILSEAASVAEQRIKEKYPEDFEDGNDQK